MNYLWNLSTTLKPLLRSSSLNDVEYSNKKNKINKISLNSALVPCSLNVKVVYLYTKGYYNMNHQRRKQFVV